MNDIVDIICSQNQSTNCPIKLDGITCDGYDENTKIGVFSHFHSDHIKSIPICISTYDTLITHKLTFEGINALQPGMRLREQWITQDYDTAYVSAEGTIRLLKANHIPGSSQVYVESNEKSLLYSGDFSYPDVQIRQADYLVIGSTHGDPWMDSNTDRKSVQNRMFEYIKENIEVHKQIVIQVPTGTLQEIIKHIEIGYGRKMPDDIYFVMDKKQQNVLHGIYKSMKKEFRRIVEYQSSEFWSKIRNNKKCLIFTTQLNILDEDLRKFHKIIIGRYRFTKEQPTIIPISNGCIFNLTAHASINDTYGYIASVNPKYVITDNSRSGYAKQLAKLVEQKFPHIKTDYRPYSS